VGFGKQVAKESRFSRAAGPRDNHCGEMSSLCFAKTSAETQDESVLGRVSLDTITDSVQQEDPKRANPSARGAHIYTHICI